MKKIINKILFNKFSAYSQNIQNLKLDKIKNTTHVTIHNSFTFGENSSIEFKGVCEELTISCNVIVKNFCSFLIYPDSNLHIDENVFFNNYCSINCLGNIKIGKNTMFGEGVRLYDHNHHHYYNDNGQLLIDRNSFKIGSIVVGENCWIGSNVVILNNVEIGNNVIIGANSLIYKSVPANTIVKSSSSVVGNI